MGKGQLDIEGNAAIKWNELGRGSEENRPDMEKVE
jgi:hypothetical protein